MNHERFAELIKELDGDSAETLINKNKRYSSEDDALHNFNDGAEIFGGTAADACWGYLTKHLVALRDMVKRNDFSNREDFKEKCQDSINYIRILWAIGNEVDGILWAIGNETDDEISEHDRSLLRDVVESLEERKETFKFEDIVFASHSDAQKTLSAMREIVNDYGHVSVADLYDLVGISCKFYQYQRMGWKNLSDAKIIYFEQTNDVCGYTIRFPNPIDIL